MQTNNSVAYFFIPCEQRFISGMAFSTCGVVYSVAVISLVSFFSTNYNSAQLFEGRLSNRPLALSGHVTNASF